MADLDPDKLEEVLKKSGVSERAAKKVREANSAASSVEGASPKPRSRGNGAAGIDTRSFGDL